MPTLTGPHRDPRAGGTPTSLVVLLHGIGSDGADLIGLADLLAPGLPGAAFHAPNAPDRFSEAPFGFQWYARQPWESRGERVAAVAPVVDAFVDELASGYGLGPERCALVGFSQGCIVSLHVAPRRERALAGVVGFSGAMTTGDSLAAEVRSKTPFLLVHGEQDQVLGCEETTQAVARLAEVGVPVEAHILPGLGHSINQEGLSLALAFLQRVLGA
jgi:phospholipase/carboxylesterase